MTSYSLTRIIGKVIRRTRSTIGRRPYPSHPDVAYTSGTLGLVDFYRIGRNDKKIHTKGPKAASKALCDR